MQRRVNNSQGLFYVILIKYYCGNDTQKQKSTKLLHFFKDLTIQEYHYYALPSKWLSLILQVCGMNMQI
jgi:hypothetical protein